MAVRHDGIRFLRQDEGLLVTMYEGPAENAPVFREISVPENVIKEIHAETKPMKVSRPKAAKKASKRKKTK